MIVLDAAAQLGLETVYLATRADWQRYAKAIEGSPRVRRTGGMGKKSSAGSRAGRSLEVIKALQFPQPKSSGLITVRYPFTFRPTGG